MGGASGPVSDRCHVTCSTPEVSLSDWHSDAIPHVYMHTVYGLFVRREDECHAVTPDL